MSTTFVVHPFSEETTSDQLSEWPTYDYTDWTFDLTISRREGSSPTLDLEIQSAPVGGDDDLYQQEATFTSADSNTTLPFTETVSVSFSGDERFYRLKQTVTGEWWYRVEATVTLFDPGGEPTHQDLLDDEWEGEPDLKQKAAQAEDDVVRRYSNNPSNRLDVRPREGVGEALREAIARRVDWLYRDELIRQNRDQSDHIRRESHKRDEWQYVDDALERFDAREAVFML